MSIYTLKLMTLDRQLIFIGCTWLTSIGVFTIKGSVFDVFLLVLFGAVGYYMRRYGYPVAAAAIAVILGPGLEANLRRGLLLTQGNVWAFVTRPYTAALLAVAFGFLIYGTIGTIRLSRMAAATRRQSIAEHIAGLSASDAKSR
jgi:putative tricarboxylic transport membrane protein